MFAASLGDAVIQVHGVGPFHIRWRDGLATLDAPGATTFRYHRGDTVMTPRGRAVVADGYGSGPLIQYVLLASDGSRFMAIEGALRSSALH
jgi:hypothetical protein